MTLAIDKFSNIKRTNHESNSEYSFDVLLLLSAFIILSLGLIMVASTSVSIADKNSAEPFYYFIRQFAFAVVGIIAGFIVFKIPLFVWQKLGPALVVSSVVLLLMVFLPGVGKEVNGSVRWLAFGPINIQVSEIVKLFLVIYLSGYLVRHQDSVRSEFRGFFRPLMVLVVIVTLLMFQPDYGASVVMLATAMCLMWLGGVKLFQYLFLVLSVVAAFVIMAIVSPYRMERLTGFLNPWDDPFNRGFQLTQALIAIGRGEWFGVGLGASVQKLFYLPEAHTDFLFSVLAEELGLFGAVSVIVLFTIIILRAFRIGRIAEQNNQPFAGYMAYGIGIWIGLQAYINIGVNMGILPTKGLTLPLMSYGGSSLVVMCIALALLLRIDNETGNRIKVTDKVSKKRKK
ncbi:Cell division protein FtsW [hydrothermal vent metagenome]|uniref:peptidoglycan glycosyltransferase n=1 Tax=hydrothermal vent metagenome TaxID=652676 RepID=A0A3B0ZZY4_9ZZZZ